MPQMSLQQSSGYNQHYDRLLETFSQRMHEVRVPFLVLEFDPNNH
jgi:hypothetical protein